MFGLGMQSLDLYSAKNQVLIREVKSAMPALNPRHPELRKHLWAGEQARKAQTSHNRQMKASSGLQTSLEALFGLFFFL